MADIIVISLDDSVDASVATINSNFAAINTELGNHTHSPSQISAGGASAGQILRWTGSAWAPASGLVVDGSGRIGLGSSSPTHPLHVDVSSDGLGMRLDRNGSQRALVAQDSNGGVMQLCDSSGASKLYLGGGYYSKIPQRLGINLPDGSWPDYALHIYDQAGANMGVWVENNYGAQGAVAQVRCLAWSGTGTPVGGFFVGHGSRGTKASPTALQTGDVLARFIGTGQQSTTAGTGAMIEFVAASGWSDTNRESNVIVRINGPGQAAFPPAERLRVESVGAMVLQPAMQTPSSPAASSEAKIYIRSNKLVVQYNDAGTVRYKYLDLTGTGVTWVHTTTEP